MGKDEKDKKSFILYSDLLDRIEMLTIEERGILFTHLLEYVNDKEPILTDRLLLAVWKPIELELKRNFKKYEEAKESKVIGGRLGNLKRWNPDLYERVIDKKLSLEEAEKIAISRKVSHTDKKVSHTDKEVSLHIASVAVDVDDNVDVDVDDNVDVDVDVDDNVILLEKETKNNICETSDFEVLEYEEIKKEKSSAKKEKRFNFKKALIDYGFEENLVNEWLQVRKAKKAVNTETAFNSFIREIESRPCDINSMLRIAVERSWSGFKHQWVDNLNSNNNGKQQIRTQQQVFIDTANSDSARNFKM